MVEFVGFLLLLSIPHSDPLTSLLLLRFPAVQFGGKQLAALRDLLFRDVWFSSKMEAM